ncbi:MAG: hypothetical protein MUE54_01170, partial [Anaerolineae bacterium]|nr:hypothetical protein [Anaerolineae bacterium]
PINDATRILIILFALISLIINHRLILNGILPVSRIKLIWGLFAIILILWLANRATFSSEHYSAFGFDSGFYHIPTIKWFSEYPVILGLGNVHTRFGFSNAFFLYGALVNWDIFIGKTYQLVNTLLYMVFLSQMIWSIFALFRNEKNHLEHLFRILCIPFVILWLLYRYQENLGVPSTSNDVPIFMLSILLAGKFISHIQQKNITLSDLIHITILVAVGIVVKFNFIFGAGLLIASWGMYIIFHRQKILITLILLPFIGLLFFVPMILRSIMMTGYPFFPLTVGAVAVDWRVPEGIATSETEYIQIFARVLGDTPMFDTLINNPSTEWFSFWLQKSSQEYPVLLYPSLLLMALGVVCIIISQIIPRLQSKNSLNPLLIGWLALLAVGGFSVLFWFINAPLWRLSVGVTWFLGASLCVFGMQRLRIRIQKAIVGIFLVIITSFVIINGIQNRGVVLNLIAQIPMPEPLIWVEQSEGYSGNIIYNAQTWLCWNYDIPCVPKPLFTPLLRERIHGDMTQGYRITPVAMPIDPSQSRIQLVHETFSALKIDHETAFDIVIKRDDEIITKHSTTIPIPQIIDRNQISYSSMLGSIDIPPMPSGVYQIIGTWEGINRIVADIWQVQRFQFENILQLTDVLILKSDNRTTVQLVGEALATIPSRYHIAIWLRGENGTFQQDVSPQIPTHDWKLNEHYPIQAYFDNVPHGNYTLSVIFYDVYAPNLPRLNGFDDQNNPLGDEVILLTFDL